VPRPANVLEQLRISVDRERGNRSIVNTGIGLVNTKIGPS